MKTIIWNEKARELIKSLDSKTKKEIFMKISKSTKKLAKDLGLSDADTYIMELKARLYLKSAQLIMSSMLSHEQIAKQIGTSRSRINRIAHHGENSVSLEILLKIITTLEGKPLIKFAA